MADHECNRCPECGSCAACAADALDTVTQEVEAMQGASESLALASMRAERDEALHNAAALTKERNAALALAEQRDTAYGLALREVDEARRAHDAACLTIARMYSAATGSTDGPRIGFIEDVAAIRAERDSLLSRAAPPSDAAPEAELNTLFDILAILDPIDTIRAARADMTMAIGRARCALDAAISRVKNGPSASRRALSSPAPAPSAKEGRT